MNLHNSIIKDKQSFSKDDYVWVYFGDISEKDSSISADISQRGIIINNNNDGTYNIRIGSKQYNYVPEKVIRY
jgi:hypothetical protein